MTIDVKQVDAFTDTPLTGNPAAVVVDARHLTDEQMQAIAREMALSETAFILPPSTPAADLRIRWFTPTVEVDLCGHATIAGFHALAEDGLYGLSEPGSHAFKLETKSGILPVAVEKSADTIQVFLGLPLPEFVRAGQIKLDLMRVLNIQMEDFESRMPLVVADYLYVPIRRLHIIFAMRPNFFALAQYLRNKRYGGLCVFTTETVDRESAVHSRFFAPHLGIDEDPVTGSANGPLGVYLFERGLLDVPGSEVTVTGEQGDVLGRRGRVIIQLAADGSHLTSVRIGGRAVTILEGRMAIG
jgi:PhzF family phenazine biosynthesis protein